MRLTGSGRKQMFDRSPETARLLPRTSMLQRAFSAVDALPNAIDINMLEFVDCLREPAPTPLFKI